MEQKSRTLPMTPHHLSTELNRDIIPPGGWSLPLPHQTSPQNAVRTNSQRSNFTGKGSVHLRASTRAEMILGYQVLSCEHGQPLVSFFCEYGQPLKKLLNLLINFLKLKCS